MRLFTECVLNVVFLDLAKAFDKVPHKRLLEKLKKHGINGNVLNIIEDWLKDRRQRLMVWMDQSLERSTAGFCVRTSFVPGLY